MILFSLFLFFLIDTVTSVDADEEAAPKLARGGVTGLVGSELGGRGGGGEGSGLIELSKLLVL